VLGRLDQLDGDRIGQVLHHELLLADSLQPERRRVHGRLGMDGDLVVDVPDIPKRHPPFGEGHGEQSIHNGEKKENVI
jgi:hypothetical protein